MKKTLWVVLIILVAVLAVGRGKEVSTSVLASKSPSNRKMALKESLVPAAVTATATADATTVTAIQKDKLKEDYHEAANALAKKLEELKLHGDDMDSLMTKVGKENFLKHVPKEVRPYYERLEAAVGAMSQAQLITDGMSEKFFTKYQGQMPEWVKNEREALKAHALPSDVKALVDKMATESELSNEDINSVLTGCGKGNQDCINKAFALLIDANHGLDDHQMKTIQEYL